MCVCARIYVCMHKLKCIYIYASILYLCIYPYTKGIKLLFKVIEAIIIQNNNGRYLSFPLYCSSQDLTRKLWICKTSIKLRRFVALASQKMVYQAPAWHLMCTRLEKRSSVCCFVLLQIVTVPGFLHERAKRHAPTLIPSCSSSKGLSN